VTRVQVVFFAMLVAILVVGFWGVRTFSDVRDRIPDEAFVHGAVHGIETTWHSAHGVTRAWSLVGERRDYSAWLDEHAAVVGLAQARFPAQEER
jgi:hypothetical protein